MKAINKFMSEYSKMSSLMKKDNPLNKDDEKRDVT